MHAKHREAPDVRVDFDLEDVGEGVLLRIGLRPELAGFLVRLTSNPLEEPRTFKTAGGRESRRARGRARSEAARPRHVFKIEIDPYIGRLAVFSRASGRLTPGRPALYRRRTQADQGRHLFLLRGKQQLEVHEALRATFCAIAKIDEIQFDHVLHDSPRTRRCTRGRSSCRPRCSPGGAAKKRGDGAEGFPTCSTRSPPRTVLPHRA